MITITDDYDVMNWSSMLVEYVKFMDTFFIPVSLEIATLDTRNAAYNFYDKALISLIRISFHSSNFTQVKAAVYSMYRVIEYLNYVIELDASQNCLQLERNKDFQNLYKEYRHEWAIDCQKHFEKVLEQILIRSE